MEDRYTDGVKNAWKFAAQEAAKLGSDYIGTEHLLIGIAHEGDSAGGKILNSLGIFCLLHDITLFPALKTLDAHYLIRQVTHLWQTLDVH